MNVQKAHVYLLIIIYYSKKNKQHFLGFSEVRKEVLEKKKHREKIIKNVKNTRERCQLNVRQLHKYVEIE